jgi:hypothetical protein
VLMMTGPACPVFVVGVLELYPPGGGSGHHCVPELEGLSGCGHAGSVSFPRLGENNHGADSMEIGAKCRSLDRWQARFWMMSSSARFGLVRLA